MAFTGLKVYTLANEAPHYTVKYLGITNGELGILSQRKQLFTCNSAFRSAASSRPQTQLRSLPLASDHSHSFPVKSLQRVPAAEP